MRAYRIAFYGSLLVLFLRTRWDDYAGVAAALYGGPFPAPGSWLPWLRRFWLLTLATSCLGLAQRLSSVLAFVLGTYLLSLDWFFGNTHHGYHLIWLCLGAWAGTAREDKSPLPLCRLLWCLVFFNAGLAKLRHSGLAFASGENFQHILLLTRAGYGGQLNGAHLLLLQHTWLAGTLAALAWLLELCAPLAFFYAGWPRAVIVLGLACLQVGASQLMFLNDFRKMAACYVFWIPWERIGLCARPPARPGAGAESAPGCGPGPPAGVTPHAPDPTAVPG